MGHTLSIVTTRTVRMVVAVDKRGVEGAPIVSMGVNAVYLVQILSKGRVFTRGEKGSRSPSRDTGDDI